MTAPLTPSQTIGPFFHHGLVWTDGPFVIDADAPEAIWLRGRIVDGAGELVTDALVETWQAGPDGRFDHPDDPRGRAAGFRGFGRCVTDVAGEWAVRTLKPGSVPALDGEGWQAPHVDVSVFARGLLDRLVTRLYFADESVANGADPVLCGLDPARRGTLLAEPSPDGYRWEIRLQGRDATVFFAV